MREVVIGRIFQVVCHALVALSLGACHRDSGVQVDKFHQSKTMASEEEKAKPFRFDTQTGLPVRNAKIPEGFELDEGRWEGADPYTVSYLALAPVLDLVEVGDLTLITGEAIFCFSKDDLPGSVLRDIGLIPIAFAPDGITFCVSLESGEIFYVNRDWIDRSDPDHLQGGFDSQTGRNWTRSALSVEELRRREALIFPSLLHFFSYLDRVRFNSWEPGEGGHHDRTKGGE
jgi:hypothetical protein